MGIRASLLNPYVDPTTQTYANKLGADTPDKLKQVETSFTQARTRELKQSPVNGDFDFAHLREINRRLLQDVYTWAGRPRENFDAAKQEFAGGPAHSFTPSTRIEQEAQRIFSQLHARDGLRGLSRDEFIPQAARLHGELNQFHAFPEGNGRTQRIFLEQLASRAGHPVDLSIGTQERIIQASIAQTNGDHTRIERLFREGMDPNITRSLRTAIDFLEKNWGKENVNGTYIAATTPGQSYGGKLFGHNGSGDFLLREDNGTLLVGHSADISSQIKPGERLQFVASTPQAAHLRQALPKEFPEFEFRHQHGDIATFQRGQNGSFAHVDSAGTFYDHHAKAISMETAKQQALGPGHANSQGLGLSL